MIKALIALVVVVLVAVTVGVTLIVLDARSGRLLWYDQVTPHDVRDYDFEATPVVLNGFSDLIVQLWGEAGVHARSALGVASLPFAVPVEVQAVVEVGY